MTTPTSTAMKFCHACGRTIDRRAEICPLCGVRQPMEHPQDGLGLNAMPTSGAYLLRPGGKSRITAGIFALLLGSFGVHKFYLGETKLGILYLLFFWTGIPGLIGFIEGIIYLIKSDEEFAADRA
jgi:hypothetical protein